MAIHCADCNVWFGSEAQYRYHRRVSHRCCDPFLGRPDLAKKFEPLLISDGPLRVRCRTCGVQLLARNANEHDARHTRSCECRECGRRFGSDADLRAHREMHQNVQVVCPECGIGFKSRSVFRSHRARKHADTKSAVLLELDGSTSATSPSSSSANYRHCPLCQKQLHKNSLLKHIERNHKKDSETGKDEESVEDLTCQICVKTFASKETLRTHQQLHSTVKKFSCAEQDCGEKFQTKRGLDWHRQRTGHRSLPAKQQPAAVVRRVQYEVPFEPYTHAMPSPLLSTGFEIPVVDNFPAPLFANL